MESWHAWLGVQTQWRTGMAGATGLDYAGVRAWLDMSELGRSDRRSVFADLVAMERATLEVWSEQRQKAESA